MATALTTGYSMVLPVYKAQKLPGDAFRVLGQVYGSCFAIGGNYMITAGHVIESLEESDEYCAVVGLTDPEGKYQKGALVRQKEVLPNDIGILQVEFVFPSSADWFLTMPWRNKEFVGFEMVRSCGYAYGMHKVEERQSCVIRAFQGTIVANLKEFKPWGMDGLPFPVYELSFQVPRGLSGSPLLSSDQVSIGGVLIGNSDHQMLVFQSEEQEDGPEGKLVVRHFESLSLGIAVQERAIFPLRSRVLRSTVGEHLARNSLLES